MKRALTKNIRSSNNEVSRFFHEIYPPTRRFPDVEYRGGVREYEDAADYVDVRAVMRGRVIA